MKALLTAALSGLLFALGLGLAGMTDPSKVIGFLDVTGDWDPSLAFVMGGAVTTYALLRRLILRRQAPVLAESFPAAAPARIDRSLIAGSALFGIGWGLAGYCPGPGIVSAVAGRSALWFAVAMITGMGLHRVFTAATASSSSSASTGSAPRAG